jgi:beta-1,4-mannosyl-glycoprotein beta-1,4-N-acetylglucosaminyltransferase
MKLLDTILFNGDLIIKLRLKYLYQYVDRFYICEKRYTYQGEKKETLFLESCADWFDDYKEKCVFLVDESEPGSTSWETEKAHRNFSANYILEDYPKEEFLCICADVDEIPNIHLLHNEKENIYLAAKNGAVHLKQKMYYYNLQWFAHDWFHSFLINDSCLKENSDIELYRGKKGKSAGVLECGWHFSYFMTRQDILRKIKSFSHTEYNTDEYKDEEYIDDCILYGQDLYRRDWFPPLTRENPDQQNYPPEILEFHKELLTLQRNSIIH